MKIFIHSNLKELINILQMFFELTWYECNKLHFPLPKARKTPPYPAWLFLQILCILCAASGHLLFCAFSKESLLDAISQNMMQDKRETKSRFFLKTICLLWSGNYWKFSYVTSLNLKSYENWSRITLCILGLKKNTCMLTTLCVFFGLLWM